MLDGELEADEADADALVELDAVEAPVVVAAALELEEPEVVAADALADEELAVMLMLEAEALLGEEMANSPL